MNAFTLDNDVALASKLKEADEKAFSDLYTKYHKSLYCIAFKYLKSQSLAEDALQDIFLKLWINKERLNEQLSVKGFLFTALKNHVLNILRDKKTEVLKNAEILSGSRKFTNDTENDFVLAEYADIVDSGIKQLSPQRQLIFRLRTYQGLTNDEVAAQLGISINTVKFQFSQASKFLRDYIKNHTGIKS